MAHSGWVSAPRAPLRHRAPKFHLRGDFIFKVALSRDSRFQPLGSWLDLGLSSCPLVDSRLASRRLALVCKLPLILGDLRHLSRTNQYPLAADLQRQAPTPIELAHR